ncbi:MAG: tRNA pseudouridine(38-40) synthase TruA [Deltaproteobacteria bacterium]|nr:tRNA pseudouridine(38-40) synthase TruA [Deltaproteobacteria bacterium]
MTIAGRGLPGLGGFGTVVVSERRILHLNWLSGIGCNRPDILKAGLIHLSQLPVILKVEPDLGDSTQGAKGRFPFPAKPDNGRGVEERRNIRLVLAYDGTGYHGWQRQKREPTIQALVEEALDMMTGERVTVIASGRTDAGVHALCQVCHFTTGSGIDTEGIRRGLNSLLPGDIRIQRAETVPIDFHSRYDARSKVYEYRIWNHREPDVFLRRYAWHVPVELGIEAMGRCLNLLTGRHDFSSFRSTGSGNINPIREILRAEIHPPRDGLLVFEFEADGFLRHMVRNMVGTLVDVGKGKTGVEEFRDVLRAGDRRLAGIKAPPQGLFLKRVRY